MNRSLALLVAGASLCSSATFAQSGSSSSVRSEETIILKRNNSQPQTTIEIGDGQVRVNGETVATLSGAENKNIRKRIIIDSGDDLPEINEPDRPSVVRKTVLGVLTETTQSRDGALVKRVLDNSAAEDAELRTGDRIYKVDNKQIRSSEDLVALIGGHQPGDKVVISYERDGKNRSTTATLRAADPATTEIPTFPFGGAPGMGNDEMPNGMFRSMPFGDFEEQLRSMRERAEGSQRPRLGISVEDRGEGDGVRVAEVTEGSAAEKAGLKEGDIITHVEGEPLESVDDLQRRVRGAVPGDALSLRYERGGKKLTANVTLPKVIRKRDL